ncbi:MAG: hypothetical protein LBH43_10015 [Treponema sp.]|jgi:hypothetical protein|nr:hypothetical protein [Treponema sp.]
MEFSDGDIVSNLTDEKDATVTLYAVWSLTEEFLEREYKKGDRLYTSIPAHVTRAVLTGVRGDLYPNARIVVAQRTLPLTIELRDVYAVGQRGNDGGMNVEGSAGSPVISMGTNNARVPDLTIISVGASNRLVGGAGGNGGKGTTGTLTKRPGVGKRAGNGMTAIIADKVTIIGDITLSGGNGGEGGRSGDKGAYMGDGNAGGNGGNGGTPLDANKLTVHDTVIVYGGKGGLGGVKWNGGALPPGGRAGSGKDGTFTLKYDGPGTVLR